MNFVRVHHTELSRFITDVFAAKGMSAQDAAAVADVLVWANLRGVDSHGAMRIPGYLDQIRKASSTPRRSRPCGRSCPRPSCSTARAPPARPA